VLATRGNDQDLPATQARFTNTAGTPVLTCQDGAVDQPLAVSIRVDAVGGSTANNITSVSAILIMCLASRPESGLCGQRSGERVPINPWAPTPAQPCE
jgi:hypothetical protein